MAAMFIAIVAAGDGEVIFDGQNNNVLFNVMGADHTYFEGLTFRNTGIAIEAGIDRKAAYVTNAVKHFKFTATGRRRLHQSPDAGDIAHYRPFLRREIDLVGPRLVVSLGATALRALTGKPLAVTKVRGAVIETPDGLRIFPTVHPSYLLRLPDPASKAREYERFVGDLAAAQRAVR
jgi:DNA polymerase